METDQYRAFFRDIARRKAGAVAIAPSRAVDCWQQGFCIYVANAFEVFFQHALLGRYLCGEFMCCIEQPPQTPKCGQRGVVRTKLSFRIAIACAFSKLAFLR